METLRDKPGFATMQKVENLERDVIYHVFKDHLEKDVLTLTDSGCAYGVLNLGQYKHKPAVVGSGKTQLKPLL